MKRVTRHGRGAAWAVLGLLMTAPILLAQEPAGEETDFEKVLFPPELIMQHRRAIELTNRQRDEITGLIENLQGTLVRLQWELLDEMQELTRTLEHPRVDLDRAMDQLGSALNLEKDIKEAHLELLIRMKNVLTPEQQSELHRLRAAESSGPPDDSQPESE
jgi:Spy/CpxP family protein refolding chaperone